MTHEMQTLVIEDTKNSRVVGSGTIFVERKFVHTNGLVNFILLVFEGVFNVLCCIRLATLKALIT